jgi:hypothetical protein
MNHRISQPSVLPHLVRPCHVMWLPPALLPPPHSFIIMILVKCIVVPECGYAQKSEPSPVDGNDGAIFVMLGASAPAFGSPHEIRNGTWHRH